MSWKVGLRIVDLGELARQMYCADCDSSLDLNLTESERQFGFASVLKIVCQCGKCNYVQTGRSLTPSRASDEMTSFDINKKVSSEMVAFQTGRKTVIDFLALLNIPAFLLISADHTQQTVHQRGQGQSANSPEGHQTIGGPRRIVASCNAGMKQDTVMAQLASCSPEVSTVAAHHQASSSKRRRKLKNNKTMHPMQESMKFSRLSDSTDQPVEQLPRTKVPAKAVTNFKTNLVEKQILEDDEDLKTTAGRTFLLPDPDQKDANIEENPYIESEAAKMFAEQTERRPCVSKVLAPPAERRRSKRSGCLQAQQTADSSQPKLSNLAKKKTALGIDKTTNNTKAPSSDSTVFSRKIMRSSRRLCADTGDNKTSGQKSCQNTQFKLDEQKSGKAKTNYSAQAVTSVTSSKLWMKSKPPQKFQGENNAELNIARRVTGMRTSRLLASHILTDAADGLSRSERGKTTRKTKAGISDNRQEAGTHSGEAQASTEKQAELHSRNLEQDVNIKTHPTVTLANKSKQPTAPMKSGGTQKVQKSAYHCPQCNSRFVLSREYTCHMRQQHNLDNPHECPRCQQSFPTEHQLKRHRRQHAPVEEHHECTICLKVFPTGRRLRAHRTTHTKEERFQPLKRYKCDICGDEFPKNYFLQIHLNHHKGKKPYQCFICDESFFTKPERHAHYKKCVAKTKCYLCELCGGRFGSVSSLRKHERVHSGRNHIAADSVTRLSAAPTPCVFTSVSTLEKHPMFVISVGLGSSSV